VVDLIRTHDFRKYAHVVFASAPVAFLRRQIGPNVIVERHFVPHQRQDVSRKALCYLDHRFRSPVQNQRTDPDMGAAPNSFERKR
jgi:hypothetical protein